MYVITYGRSSYSREDLDRQLQLLRRSLPSGDVVLGAYGDVAPGTSTQRPALQEALALLATGAAEALFVTSLDRLSRSREDLVSLGIVSVSVVP